MVVVELNGHKLYLDGFLKQKLDNVKLLTKKKWDNVFLIDGIEGSGKSTLSFGCGWYISDGKMTMNNIAEGTEDAIKKLQTLPDESVLIIDEGSLSFSSKDVMRKENRRLETILQIIRQKRMCLIIVSPSFFNLSKYISVERSRFLLHVYTAKDLERGRFSYFGEKKKKQLYVLGKKNYNSYSKPRANFRGRFAKFDPFGEEYQDLKRKSLKESFDGNFKVEINPQVLYAVKKELILKLAPNLPIETKRDLAKYTEIPAETLSRWLKTLKKPFIIDL